MYNKTANFIDLESDDSDDNEEIKSTSLVTVKSAMNSINELQKYFWQKSDNSLDHIFAKMQKIITNDTFENLKQSKITDFFQ